VSRRSRVSLKVAVWALCLLPLLALWSPHLLREERPEEPLEEEAASAALPD